MAGDSLHPWEHYPVAALVAAAGLNTAVWYVGVPLAGHLPTATQVMLTLAAVASVIAIDGALIATIAGMREGRRSRWSTANIIVCAVFTGLAALSAHGVLPGVGAWLHGLFALTIVTYAMHLAQPRQDAVARLAARAAALDKALAEHAANVAAWGIACDKAQADQSRLLTEQGALIDKAWAELHTREQAMASRTEIVTTEYVEVASARLSWAELHQLVDTARQRGGISQSTLRRLVTKQEGE